MPFRLFVCIALFAAAPLGADNHGEVKYWSHEDLQALPAELQAVLDEAPKDRVPYSQGVSPRHLLDEREGAGHYMDVVHRERSGLAELHEVKPTCTWCSRDRERFSSAERFPEKRKCATVRANGAARRSRAARSIRCSPET